MDHLLVLDNISALDISFLFENLSPSKKKVIVQYITPIKLNINTNANSLGGFLCMMDLSFLSRNPGKYFVMLHSNFRIKMKYLKQKYYQEQAGDPCCPYSANSTLT
jgi:hypothetical protein